jgi:hypothetical protein
MKTTPSVEKEGFLENNVSEQISYWSRAIKLLLKICILLQNSPGIYSLH